jgi:hypothetical protein
MFYPTPPALRTISLNFKVAIIRKETAGLGPNAFVSSDPVANFGRMAGIPGKGCAPPPPPQIWQRRWCR